MQTHAQEGGVRNRTAEPGTRASAGAWYTLGVLAIATFMALLDRQIMLLLAEPIRQELQLSDFQLGLLQGAGVALFAALASFPLGWLADRFDRRIVLAGCVAFWSLAVCGCAIAAGFPALLFSSAMVGAGEAGLAPVMYALIPLLFFGRQRQLANSIAALATVGGGALAFVVCGQIIATVEAVQSSLPATLANTSEWRLSLFAAALPAPLLIILILSLPKPKSPVSVPGTAMLAEDPGRVPAWTYFRRHRSTFTRFYFGMALGGFAYVAMSVWVAIIASRLFGQSPLQIGSALGLVQVTSGGIGFALSVLATRRWQPRLGDRLPVRIMWIAMILATATCLTLLTATSALQLFVSYGLIGIALTLATMVFPTALQAISPQHLRGRSTSIQFIISMSLGACAPPLVGFVSDRLGHLPQGPLIAVVIVAAPALLASALMLLSCERRGLDAALADASRIDGEVRAV